MRLDLIHGESFKENMDAHEGRQAGRFDSEVQVHALDLKTWLNRKFPGLKDPENVVQEALTRVWRRMTGQKVNGSYRALLYVTARNLAIDEIRRNKVIGWHSLTELEELAVDTTESNAAEIAGKNQELELLTLAIQSLPQRCRQVLTLRKIYGLSQKAIAEQMGISEHTVEAQVANGMRRCASFLKAYGLP